VVIKKEERIVTKREMKEIKELDRTDFERMTDEELQSFNRKFTEKESEIFTAVMEQREQEMREKIPLYGNVSSAIDEMLDNSTIIIK